MGVDPEYEAGDEWEVRFHQVVGIHYYQNIFTTEVAWQRPSILGVGHEELGTKKRSSSITSRSSMDRPHTRNPSNLRRQKKLRLMRARH